MTPAPLVDAISPKAMVKRGEGHGLSVHCVQVRVLPEQSVAESVTPATLTLYQSNYQRNP